MTTESVNRHLGGDEEKKTFFCRLHLQISSTLVSVQGLTIVANLSYGACS